jgi:hypothetical protein
MRPEWKLMDFDLDVISHLQCFPGDSENLQNDAETLRRTREHFADESEMRGSSAPHTFHDVLQDDSEM